MPSYAECSRDSRGREGSLAHGVIVEVVSELCLERKSSLKSDKERQTVQEKDLQAWKGNPTFRSGVWSVSATGG